MLPFAAALCKRCPIRSVVPLAGDRPRSWPPLSGRWSAQAVGCVLVTERPQTVRFQVLPYGAAVLVLFLTPSLCILGCGHADCLLAGDRPRSWPPLSGRWSAQAVG